MITLFDVLYIPPGVEPTAISAAHETRYLSAYCLPDRRPLTERSGKFVAALLRRICSGNLLPTENRMCTLLLY